MRFPKPSRTDRLRERRSARQRRLEDLTAIRLACVLRSRGRCENPDCRSTTGQRVMDHWLGGMGRRRQEESFVTCWMLCLDCNRKRTDNVPDAGTWNRRFEKHSARYGYPFTPHRAD